MARHKKINSTKELVEYWEAEVLRTKKAYDDALEKLKEARDKDAKEMQETLLKAMAQSRWSYDQILEVLQKDPSILEEL